MATAKQRAAKRPSKKTTSKSQAKSTSAVADTAKMPASSKRLKSPAAKTPKKNVPAESVSEPINEVAAHRLPSAWTIGRQASSLLWGHRKLFGGILLVYVLISVLVVRGFTNTANLSSLKHTLSGNFSGSFAGLWTGLTVYTVLVTTSGTNASGLTVTYQALLAIIISLATVWALRQSMLEGTGANIRIRDAFYRGMYPLIPVFLVLLVVQLQLIPFIFSGYLYGLITSGGIAVHVIERIIWLIVLLGGAGLTGYWLTSSLLALYVATLPEMTPMKALRSARQLVKGRRWAVIRKLLALPLGLFIGAAIVMVPVILVLPGIAGPVLIGLSLIGLILGHSYMYTLYRELLK